MHTRNWGKIIYAIHVHICGTTWAPNEPHEHKNRKLSHNPWAHFNWKPAKSRPNAIRKDQNQSVISQTYGEKQFTIIHWHKIADYILIRHIAWNDTARRYQQVTMSNMRKQKYWNLCKTYKGQFY